MEPQGILCEELKLYSEKLFGELDAKDEAQVFQELSRLFGSLGNYCARNSPHNQDELRYFYSCDYLITMFTL
jgi:hypothetical protein